MKKIVMTFACALALSVPVIASADVELKQIEEDKVLVTYNATEASTDEGRVELERQVRRAAERVCGPQMVKLAGSVSRLMQNRACYEEAVEAALKTIEATA